MAASRRYLEPQVRKDLGFFGQFGYPGVGYRCDELIHAMRDGIENQIDPGPPEERNIYEAMKAGKDVKRIPMTFGEALEALDNDEVIKASMPGDMYRVFRHYKWDEWERYCATVTDWDVQEYLDILP